MGAAKEWMMAEAEAAEMRRLGLKEDEEYAFTSCAGCSTNYVAFVTPAEDMPFNTEFCPQCGRLFDDLPYGDDLRIVPLRNEDEAF